MREPRKIVRAVLLLLASAADLFALTLWAVRPSGLPTEWVTFSPGREGKPIGLVRLWWGGYLAPRTPSGFISLFETADLLFASVLLVALLIFATLLAATWLRRGAGALATSLRPPRPRLRVRAALVAIALIGLYLGWEVEGWESWRLARHYAGQRQRHAQSEKLYRENLARDRTSLAWIEAGLVWWDDLILSEEAVASSRASTLDFLRRATAEEEAMLAYHERLRKKYEDAAAHPRARVEPDPPQPVPDLYARFSYTFTAGQYDRDLARLDDRIRRYPGLIAAHERRAWLLATCPDDRIRDGKAAVASARRACELSNWTTPNLSSTLAAAYAEAGDFRSAVAWERWYVDRSAALNTHRQGMRRFAPSIEYGLPKVVDRLDLYRAGKPFRMSGH